MAIGRRAYTAIRTHLLEAAVAAALLALCVGCCALASTAPASPLAAGASSRSTSSPVAHRRHHRFHCARTTSFHSSGKPTGASHRRHHRFFCHRRRHGQIHHHSVPQPPASSYGACTGTQLRPSAANLALVRAATLCLINRERTSRGESALRADADLTAAAQNHSSDMSSGDYFEHDGRHGDTPLSRMRAAGYIFSSHIGYAVGENIAWATLWMASPKAIVAGWMASPGHRANILDATFKDTGIGVSPHPLASLARGQAGAIYTQDFGRIIRP
ncbi:MAG: CAP domain-containing protein [Solirubrobacteraceae bacterium]